MSSQHVTINMLTKTSLSLFILTAVLLLNNVAAVDLSSSEDVSEEIITVKSPSHRVATLELYTSEGCSSCPPADRFLSNLKASGINDKQLIAMAFHVTYWDYIGWKDRYANKEFDNRQRELANKNSQSTVYTPQFVLSGDDYRQYDRFKDDINQLISQKASLDLELSASNLMKNVSAEHLNVKLQSDFSKANITGIKFYIAVIENNLFSDVSDGENAGERLHHDYVVRYLDGPYFRDGEKQKLIIESRINIQAEWKKQDLSIVAFAENPRSGEVLQAVRLDY